MDPIAIGAIVLVSALIVGALIWAVRAREISGLRSDLADREKQLVAATTRLEMFAGVEQKLTDEREKTGNLNTEIARLKTHAEAEADSHAAQITALSALRSDIEQKFENIANSALKANSEGFLVLAGQTLETQKQAAGGEIAQKTIEIAGLLKPVADSLARYETALTAIESARQENYGGLRNELAAIRELNGEVKSVTARLVNALQTAPKTRGRWGEESLKRVMELCGMIDRCDFETEKTFKGEDALRPDAIVHIAGGRHFVVDAKAPISAFFDAINATSEADRNAHLVRHAAQFRERVANLSSKSYWEKLDGSPDCVVMFVPGDPFLIAALEQDSALFDDALSKRVLITTPTTFIALAKAISYGWRQERLAESALEIAKIGKELYTRLRSLGGHIGGLGKYLDRSVRKFNDLVGSLEGNVMPQARRFDELGVQGTSEPLAIVDTVDTVVRFPRVDRDLLISSGEMESGNQSAMAEAQELIVIDSRPA